MGLTAQLDFLPLEVAVQLRVDFATCKVHIYVDLNFYRANFYGWTKYAKLLYSLKIFCYAIVYSQLYPLRIHYVAMYL